MGVIGGDAQLARTQGQTCQICHDTFRDVVCVRILLDRSVEMISADSNSADVFQMRSWLADCSQAWLTTTLSRMLHNSGSPTPHVCGRQPSAIASSVSARGSKLRLSPCMPVRSELASPAMRAGRTSCLERSFWLEFRLAKLRAGATALSRDRTLLQRQSRGQKHELRFKSES